MKYEFIKEKHQHFLDGKQLTGCTTILGILSKPALIQWSANIACEYVRDNLKKLEDLENVLKDARVAHCKKKEKAGDFGTKTHAEIEKMINDAISENDGYIRGITVEDKPIINFFKWATENKVKFLASEKNIYSEKLFIGGIVDFICEIDSKVWIGDIKTSKSGIYPENFAQIAGYDLMLKEMKEFDNAIGYLVLNLKEDGEMNEKRSIDNEGNTKFFINCLEIYRQLEKLKTNTI